MEQQQEQAVRMPFDPLSEASLLRPVCSQPPAATSRVRETLAIGGGKGGIGKSLIASSLAIILARRGLKVVLVDLDLGGANLHTTLGIDLPKRSLSDFFNHRIQNLSQCVVPTGIHNLGLISGAHDAVNVTQTSPHQQNDLLQKLQQIDADYLVFDLGAGTAASTIDFFLASTIRIIVLLPEPTSIENSYRFIKSAYFKQLSRAPALAALHPIIGQAMDAQEQSGITTPADLFREANRMSPQLALHLKAEIARFQLELIINQVRTQNDHDIGTAVKVICKKYFGIESNYAGSLDYDNNAWQAVRRKQPLPLAFPHSKSTQNLENIVNCILPPGKK